MPRQLYPPCVSNIIQMSVTQHELAFERESWVDRIMEVIQHVVWVVVVLSDPQLFIILCSIRQAWCHLLHTTMETTGRVISFHSQYLFDLSIKPRLCIVCGQCVYLHAHSHPHVLSMHHLFISLPLSCSHTPYLFLPAPSTSFFGFNIPR